MSAGKKRWLADAILAGSVLTACTAVPFSDSFGGGLLFHTALAAAVGGAADWFAVNSLFRKPLGISFRTELVPRSRERIIQMAVDMVEKEILTVPRLYRVLKQHSVSAAFFSWLTAHRGEVQQVLAEMLETVLSKGEFQKAATLGETSLHEAVQKTDWGAVLGQTAETANVRALAASFIAELGKAARPFIEEEWVRADLASFYQEAWTRYENKGAGRAMLKGLLESQLGLTDDKAIQLMRDKISHGLEALGNPDSPISKWALEKADTYRNTFAERKDWQNAAGTWLMTRILAWADANGEDFIQSMVKNHGEEGARWGASYILTHMEAALAKDSVRQSVDRWILKRAVGYLPWLHGQLGASVKAALETYSGADMAEAAETGASHDLQMIRVNGSLVGAVFGCASYLLFFAASGGGLP